jgi:hypothetical protein
MSSALVLDVSEAFSALRRQLGRIDKLIPRTDAV